MGFVSRKYFADELIFAWEYIFLDWKYSNFSKQL